MLTDFKEPTWAHIELFGHKTYYGRIQEVTRFGVVGAAIEPMTAGGFTETQYKNGAAIYGATPMAEEDVRRAVMPRAWRACDTFKASVALPDLCLTCGRNEPEHQEVREWKAALPPPAPIADAEVDEDDGIPFEGVPPESRPGYHDEQAARIASILGVDVRAVSLSWDDDPGTESKILDVTIARRYRPHRSTWAKLVDAGLPMLSYDAASLSWNYDGEELPPEEQAPLSGALGH